MTTSDRLFVIIIVCMNSEFQSFDKGLGSATLDFFIRIIVSLFAMFLFKQGETK